MPFFRKEKFAVVVLVTALLVTLAILTYPVQLTRFYNPLSSQYIFGDLLDFMILFYVWLGLLFVLLFLKKETRYQIAVLLLFAAVFLGIWVIVTPLGTTEDSIWIMGHVNFILNNGRIDPLNQNLIYFQFPALPIIDAVTSTLTGLNIFAASTSYLVFSALFFTFSLYVLYKNLFQNNLLASIGVLMLIEGNLWISYSQAFHPLNLSYLYFNCILLLLLFKPLTVKRVILFIIVYFALTTGYLSLSFGLLIILLVFVIVGKFSKSPLVTRIKNYNASLYLLLASSVLFLTWQISQAISLFSSLSINWLQDFFQNDTLSRFTWLLNISRANTGSEVPLWANVTRIFWIVLILGVGLVLALRSALKIRKVHLLEKNLLVWIVGVVIFGVTAIFVSSGGSQWHRLLIYLPFFTVPLILITFYKKAWFKFLVVAVLIAFSFTTFLANNSRATYLAQYPTEIAAGEFVSSCYGQGNNLHIYSTYWSETFANLDVGNASVSIEGGGAYDSVDAFWQKMNRLLLDFRGVQASGQDPIFVYSDKFEMSAQHLLGILPDDPAWSNFEGNLSRDNQVFSNENVVLFSPA